MSGYRRYLKLMPGRGWFKTSRTPQEFLKRYYAEVLDPLDPDEVVQELVDIGDGKIPTLLCYEPPEPGEEWCHRSLVSTWLKDTLGLKVFEYGQEREGCGWQHPKLHPTLRRSNRAQLAPSVRRNSFR